MDKKDYPKSNYGDVDIDEAEFAPDNIKVRITTMIDGDVKQELQRLAGLHGEKYQSILNQILRQHLFGDSVKYERRSESNIAILADIVRQCAEKLGVDASKLNQRTPKEVMESLRD